LPPNSPDRLNHALPVDIKSNNRNSQNAHDFHLILPKTSRLTSIRHQTPLLSCADVLALSSRHSALYLEIQVPLDHYEQQAPSPETELLSGRLQAIASHEIWVFWSRSWQHSRNGYEKVSSNPSIWRARVYPFKHKHHSSHAFDVLALSSWHNALYLETQVPLDLPIHEQQAPSPELSRVTIW